ncbi:MAG TPA: phage tail protein [Solirubrobacteraceae bacterium]|nr:phage tail protein [Solirubrobacteraceae bacterium]
MSRQAEASERAPEGNARARSRYRRLLISRTTTSEILGYPQVKRTSGNLVASTRCTCVPRRRRCCSVNRVVATLPRTRGQVREGEVALPVSSANPGFAAPRYALELDGVHDCWLVNAEGGYATSDVVVEKIGADLIAHKHLASVRYEDLSLTFGEGMGPGLFDWMRSAVAREWRRKNGAVVTYDYDGKEVERLEFTNALLGEIDLPALDAASKDTVRMTVRCQPEYTRKRPSANTVVGAAATAAVQKKWLPSNFRLSIGGLDCTKVSKIEGMPVGLKVPQSAGGEIRDYANDLAHLEIPDLVVALAETGATTWEQWYEDFVINGNNGADKEKSGTLDYLDPSMRNVLFSVGFRGLGIFKFFPENAEANSQNLRRVQAEMYCEQLALVAGEFGAGPPLTSGATRPQPLSRVAQQALQGLLAARPAEAGHAVTRPGQAP